MTTLVVDDHPGFRSLARRMLTASGHDVVAEAGDVAGAVRMAAELRPELVLLDVHLPDGDGFAAARRILAERPQTAVVLVSTHDPADLAPSVAASGARGFVPKHELSGRALDRVLA